MFASVDTPAFRQAVHECGGQVQGDDPEGFWDVSFPFVGAALRFIQTCPGLVEADIRKGDSVVSFYNSLVLTVRLSPLARL